jgi:hypothetical protein
MEYVRCRRVVDDDCVFEVTSDLGKVLDVVALMVIATLAEESVVNNLVNVKLVEERVAVLSKICKYVHPSQTKTLYPYLRDRRCEDNHFVEFANPLHELINARALDHIYVVVVTLNLDWYREICLVEDLL